VNEREKFINALQKNEDDTPVRLAFADWLDEQGEHEEADRHRKWPASKAWIIGFCEANQPDDELDDWEPWTYAIIMEHALEAAAGAAGSRSGGGCIDCGRNMELRYSDEWPEFWKHWSIITGIVLRPEVLDNIHYTCGC